MPARAYPPPENVDLPPFLPRVRLNHISPARLQTLARGRDIYIWGAAVVGQGLARGLAREGLEIRAFLDSSPRLHGRRLWGRPVWPPDRLLARENFRDDSFIIMSTGYWEKDMIPALQARGLAEERDFLSSRDLVALDASVDVSGVCNLRCPSCPRGNMDRHPPAGFMSPETYALVLDKFLREMPLLGCIWLYNWGEPLLNKRLGEIIRLTAERGVLSNLSTNLSLKTDLEAFVAARPDIVRISVSGCGPGYSLGHRGGDWELFQKNFRELARLRPRLAPDMVVEVFYHLYRHNAGPDQELMRQMSEDAGFIFRPALAHLLPRENTLKMRRGEPLNEDAQKALAMLQVDLPRLIEENFQAEKERAAIPECQDMRALCVNWNLNVKNCGVYYLPVIAENFLEIPLAELLRRRGASELCRVCSDLGANCYISNFMVDKYRRPGPAEET